MEPFSTLQKIAIWIAILVGVFLLSDFLINVGINSAYKNMERKDDNSDIVVYQADATYVNGRIRGLIKAKEKEQGKYLKIELYSKRNVMIGKRYIEIKDLKQEETQAFELLFRAKDATSYKAEIVKEKEQGEKLEIIPRELTKPEIVLGTIFTLLIFY